MMKEILRKPILLLVSIVLSCIAFGQNYSGGARAAGLGSASVTFKDIQSLFSNQAGLAHLTGLGVSSTVEQRFLLTDLNSIGIGAALPTRSGAFGLIINQFGFEEFRQQKVGLAYARRFLDNLTIGAQFDYMQTRINEYGNRGLLTFEAGLQVQISSQLSAGTHIFSPAKVEFGDNERLPTIYKVGLSYTPSKKALLAIELEKDIDFPARIKGGFEYQAAEPLFLRAGFGAEPNLVSFGIGFEFISGLRIDLASTYHQTLGISPAGSISFQR